MELLSSQEIDYDSSYGDEKIILSKSMFDKNKKLIGLRIKGDSMIDDSIEDGDVIIIDSSKNNSYKPKQGDMVVARLDEDSATLKRIYIKAVSYTHLRAHET